jgi:hypothetical protein
MAGGAPRVGPPAGHSDQGVAVATVPLSDPSRPYGTGDGRGPRPFLLTVWSPALAPAGPPLRLRDYVAMTVAEIRLDGRNGPPMQLVWGEVAAAAPAAAQAAALDLPFRGRPAPLAGPARPLVVAVHGTPAGYSVLGEALASAGFMVAAFQSKGASEGPYRLGVDNLEAMAADIAFVRRQLQARGVAQPGPYAVVAMSNGAVGAVGAALAGEPVSGIVSLDGTVTERAAARVVPQLRGDGALPPLLHFHTPANPYLDYGWIRAYPHEDCTLVSIAGLEHQDFLAAGWLRAAAPDVFGPSTHQRAVFEVMVQDAVAFLRRVVAGIPGGRSSSSPRTGARTCAAA